MSVDENTFGIVRGRRAARGLPISSTGARSLRQARAAGATLGTGYLGVGAAVVAALQAVYGLAFFLSHLSAYPDVAPVLISWLLYVATFIGTAVLVTVRGERLTTGVFAVIGVVLAVVVTLDFVATWPLHDVGAYATSSVAVGFGLLPIVTLRPVREVVTATALLFVAFVVMVALSTPVTSDSGPQQITVVALAVLPSAIATFAVHRFRRMVQVELDRVLVQSNVSQPRFAVGMLASDELARLDLAAEKLLDGVANGDVPLPLSPKVASQAASLATELRLHLIEGRRETWLHHAVTESEYLGRSVALVDPSSLAGLLAPAQRDGLLQGVWLLLGDSKSRAPGTTIQLTLGPVTAASQSFAGRSVCVPVVLSTTGIRRNRVTPATWNALERAGEYVVSTHESSVKISVNCIVDNPAEA
ncbi:hypothetical protein [Frigoribacterium sp. 9N]|uniref:hypothetical protein n=1 Tax=Frigoribacterium sp. 9N TaxID=2653144 RepID=UPI0012F334B3|nr:hypothetical protein [Frigoribacterium sp. 9N]VXC17989.1 conserved membrane hypothetical protein [Frigoribacterium sp. 9N]